MAYHRGSVWPHDNAILTLGLARYGLREEARTVARALTDLATHTAGRLPEATAKLPPHHPAHPGPLPARLLPAVVVGGHPLALLTALTTAEDRTGGLPS